ncbi:MAG: sulfite oxidase heme-binding subunit YedZ [Acidobacteriaceae bacterium]
MTDRRMVVSKTAVHALCLLPAFDLVRMYFNGALVAQADPVNYITHFTGNWALWILLADLAITPLRRLSQQAGKQRLNVLVRFRRMVGLYAFFYATLHLLTYVLLFSGYNVPAAIAGLEAGRVLEPWRQLHLIWPAILDDLKKRKFIQVGLVAWVILLLLAVTSPRRVLQAMGGKNWQRLHRLIYLAGVLGCVHYWWLVKTGVRTPWKVTAVLTVLLLIRMGFWMSTRAKSAPRQKAMQSEGAY